MKKNAGRANRRRLSKAIHTKNSAKKQAVNERKLLHFSRSIGEFKDKPRLLINLKGETE